MSVNKMIFSGMVAALLSIPFWGVAQNQQTPAPTTTVKPGPSVKKPANATNTEPNDSIQTVKMHKTPGSAQDNMHGGNPGAPPFSKEVVDFNNKVDQLQQALTTKNTDQLTSLQTSLEGDMRSSIEKNEARLKQAEEDAAKAQSEIKSDKKEVNRDNKTGKTDEVSGDKSEFDKDKGEKRIQNGEVRRLTSIIGRQKTILETFTAYIFNVDQQKEGLQQIASLREFSNLIRSGLRVDSREQRQEKKLEGGAPPVKPTSGDKQ